MFGFFYRHYSLVAVVALMFYAPIEFHLARFEGMSNEKRLTGITGG